MVKKIDMVGQKFGRLSIIKDAGKNKRGSALWLCKCDCGKELVAVGVQIRSGNTKSCGCLQQDEMRKFVKDLTGEVFGRLTVMSREPNKNERVRWLCLCSCGKTKIISTHSLRSGRTKSCGCIQKEGVHRTHGLSKTHKGYKVWSNMKARCDNIKCKEYVYYGGRGISYTSKWETFEGFWEDMGHTWKEGLSIDRIDVNGNYCKENCRWVSQLQQANNRRNNRMITCMGRTQSLADWCRECRLNYDRTKRRWRDPKLVLEDILERA